MNAVRNYVAVPFFDRVPPRVMDLVLMTFDNIVERAQSQREAYHFFANGVKKRGFEGPTYAEFADWHERVKNGMIDRPHPSEVVSIKPENRLFDCFVQMSSGEVERPPVAAIVEHAGHDMACEMAQLVDQEVRLEHARAIVEAAHRLFEVKIAAGYSPLSIPVDDTIVQEALREVLAAEATATVMDADVHMTPGNKLVDLLLGEGDDDIDAKLVDCLTIDMQAEICRILVRSSTAKSG